jgi:transcriptional regulator with XRE-family HTH domain
MFWTGREVRALREAMRLSIRAFSEHLGLATATITGWENRRTTVRPRLATQAVLDRALVLIDTDTRTRFRLILQSSCDTPPRDELADVDTTPKPDDACATAPPLDGIDDEALQR